MRILPLLLIMAMTMVVIPAGALEVHQTVPITKVYVGDTLNLEASWSDNIAWWAPNHDPSGDPPDRIVNITNPRAFVVTKDLTLGIWYQWGGKNERGVTYLFELVGGDRPVAPSAPAPTPAPVKEARLQPPAVADYLLSRGSPFRYECTGPCRVWIFGPEYRILTEGNLEASLPGDYHLLAQYPDMEGTYEVFLDTGGFLNSTWKDVAVVDVRGLPPDLTEARLNALLEDKAHFHGRVERKALRVEEPHADITSLGELPGGRVAVEGLTNLPAGAILSVVFDDDRVVLAEDRKRNTFTVTAVGEDPGAPRIWRAILSVDLQDLAIGPHLIAAYPPGGKKSTVSFYISETFTPPAAPLPATRYINGDPFIPTPTPIVVEREVTVTVIQTVVVNVTPAYEEVLRAQSEVAIKNQGELVTLITSTLVGIATLIAVGWVLYHLGIYLVGVRRRAKEGERHGT